MNARIRVLAVVVVCLAITACVADEEIVVVCWNVESGGAHANDVGQRIADMNGVDLWALSEVKDKAWADEFAQAAKLGEPGKFAQVLGASGGQDRLLVLYDEEQFEQLENYELKSWKGRKWYRKDLPLPLVVKLKHKATGLEFYFMANQLSRGDTANSRRVRQATELNKWADKQTVPVIAAGNYNFDFALDPADAGQNYEKGLAQMTANGVFQWLEPEHRVKTFYSSTSVLAAIPNLLFDSDRPGANSILDFIFLGKAEGKISGKSKILQKEGDFPDTGHTPCFRPVQGVLTIPASGGESSLKQQALRRITALEQELEDLKKTVQRLPD